MGGFKTVTASEGWQFKITDSNGCCRERYCTEYTNHAPDDRCRCVDPDGDGYWFEASEVELVPIKEPEPVPEAYKTVTASEGYEFRITSVYSNEGTSAKTYDEGRPTTSEIWVEEPGHGQRQRWDHPTIELVPIPKPQDRVVTAPEGYEFRIRFSAPWGAGGVTRDGVMHATEYLAYPGGVIDFSSGPDTTMRCLPDTYTIELVEVTNATSEPEPEPEPEAWQYEWQPGVTQEGDWLRIDQDGHWKHLRHSGPGTLQYHTVVEGRALRFPM